MKAWKKGLIIGLFIQIFSWFFADSFGLYGLREYGEGSSVFGLIFVPLILASLGYSFKYKTGRLWLKGGIIGFLIAITLFF